MLLLYDAKCSLCRTLAQKIHFVTEKKVEILSLSAPKAATVLEKFYPEGWPHDFYVVENGSCRRGVRALPKLLRSVGVKHMAGILSEFGQYKLSPRSCAQGNGDTAQISKRNMLKLAALSPLLYGFSKVKGEDPFEKPLDGFLVNVAEVEKHGVDEFRAHAYRCENCQRIPKKLAGAAPRSQMHMIEDSVLAEDAVQRLATKAGGASFKVKRIQFARETEGNGKTSRVVRSLHTALLDHPRFGISMNFGQSEVTSLAAMATHDLPATVLDWVVFRTEAEDASAHFAAYAEGVRALAQLHDRKGRTELSDVYLQIAEGFAEMPARFEKVVGSNLAPLRNELIITSMPEALRFVQFPPDLKRADLKAAAAGCDCSCSCNACCACGCGLGICLTPFPCFCDCCISCGCGCGCCLFEAEAT
jgi:hypothetical protein